MVDFDKLREQMVREQIRGRGIHDHELLAALRKVPRHLFVPASFVEWAYQDCPVSIGEEQTISQPYMVALMTQCLALTKDKTVLEIGTGCGYQAAVLAELARKVDSFERIEPLAARARQTLLSLGYSNVDIWVGDGTLGTPGGKDRYDAVIVTAAAPTCPATLLDQLSAHGRLVIPVGDRWSQVLKLFKKNGPHIYQEDMCGCAFVPLIGKYGWAG